MINWGHGSSKCRKGSREEGNRGNGEKAGEMVGVETGKRIRRFDLHFRVEEDR